MKSFMKSFSDLMAEITGKFAETDMENFELFFCECENLFRPYLNVSDFLVYRRKSYFIYRIMRRFIVTCSSGQHI